jgi:Stage II sporulation protein E (SpoIIE)
MRKVVLVVILLFGSLFSLKAQSFDASQWTQGVTTITAPWRFHPGDDPSFASPSFDDSNWPLLATDRYWGVQGYRGLTGYAWYRLRLKLPASSEQLAIDIGHLNSAGELYVDGKLVGTNGIMRPKPDWSSQREANSFPLPLSCNGQWVEVAIRVWKSPVASSYSAGGLHKHPVVGSLPLIRAASRVAFDDEAASAIPGALVQLLTLVLGCFSLGLFLLDRRSTEYAWFALWTIGWVAVTSIYFVISLHQGSITLAQGDLQLLCGLFWVAQVLFLWGFLRIRRDWMLPVTAVLGTSGFCALTSAYHGFIRLPAGEAAFTIGMTLAYLLIIARVLLSLRAGNRNARLLIMPIVLQTIQGTIDSVRQAIYWAGLSRSPAPLTLWSNGIITVLWGDIFNVLFLVAIAAALLLRFTRSASEEKRLATELASARSVQEHLVPAQLPTLRGLDFAAVYLPAAEVGGDFYQVFPQNDGSALIVVGDVSGKGLRAAMTGTLVLGGLRSLAQETLPPSEILYRLNNQLADSCDGGFVTCVCARISADGLLTVANAGHLAPYRNGAECEVDSGLPLGIVAGAEYSKTSVQLEVGDTLTFMSDGVVEAQADSGELFGFDRTRTISHQSAEEIAVAAQQFGQQDDITVLTVALVPAEVLQR